MDLATVDQHRAELNAVTTIASDTVSTYAQSIANEAPERVAGQLREAVPQVVGTYGDVAATSGALFYENNRPTPGWNARLATPSIDDLAGDLGWALVPLFVEGADPVGALLSRLSGVVQKHVGLYDRDTVSLNSSLDSTSGGARRYARADACAFCAYLSTVHATVHESTVWHNHCHCVTVPWWKDNPLPDNPHIDRWSDAAASAQEEISRFRADHPRGRMRSKEYFAKYPEAAATTENILRIMRRTLNLAH